MTTQYPDAPKHATPAVASQVLQTKKQTTAGLLASGLARKLLWKTLIDEAHATWPQVSSADLTAVEGNIHTLAGLVQLRHRLSREESDQQVKAFFAAHLPASNATAHTA